MTFKRGQSGNPKGRPKGTSRSQQLLKSIEGDLPEIIKSLTISAKTGDTSAAKLLIDRCLSALKPVSQTTDIGAKSNESLAERGEHIILSMTSGKISPEHSQAMLAALQSQARIVEATELEKRVLKLESDYDDA